MTSVSLPEGLLVGNATGQWRVQVGYGRGSYRDRYVFAHNERNRAVLHFNCLNTHSGHKKRLIDPDGRVVARVIT